MSVIEAVVVLLLMFIIGVEAFAQIFKKARENSFRRGLRAKGYPQQEIDDAVTNLNRRKWK